MENKYWIKGKVSIPEERREEFNKNILRLFKLCGIRKCEEIEIAGKAVTVVHEPKPDDEGMVQFDYSIFEQRKRQPSFYDMNTCELHATDRGYEEFGVVMNMVMVMQEAYSAEQCYFMDEEQVGKVGGYAFVIERTIGLKLSFPNRQRIWDMLLFFKSGDGHGKMERENIWNIIPFNYCDIDMEQLLTSGISLYDSAKKPENCFRGKKSEIKEADMMQRAYYAYELFQELVASKGENAVNTFLKDLLEKDFIERERLAGREDDFGNIAEISLYDLPACIVAAYGWAIGKEFWSVWFSLGITGYKDIHKKVEKESQKEEGQRTESHENEDQDIVSCKDKLQTEERIFHEGIQRKNEDEFLEFFDDQELCLSDDMRKDLQKWKQAYDGIDETSAAAISMEICLADILLEMQNIWGCRYVDKSLVREFMENSADIRYKKALFVFRKILDQDLEYFPELTARQAKEWIIKRCCSKEDRIRISGYASLLVNRVRRAKLFGF